MRPTNVVPEVRIPYTVPDLLESISTLVQAEKDQKEVTVVVRRKNDEYKLTLKRHLIHGKSKVRDVSR